MLSCSTDMQNYASQLAAGDRAGGADLVGHRMRRVPIRQLLGERRAGVKAWFTDFGVALIFWLTGKRGAGGDFERPARAASVARAKGGICDRATDRMGSAGVGCALGHGRHCRRICISRLFAAAGRIDQRKIDGPRKLVARRTHVFAALRRAHGYEGVGGMIAIVAFGAMFCLLAIQGENLRAGMIAHAWHDAITGIALAIAKHSRVI